MKAISRYLDEAEQKGLAKNDSDIARKIGVTRAAVSDWRAGRRAPDDDQAVKLADLLGLEAGELLAECGAARAKTPETRRAWERVAARMAGAALLVVCGTVMHIETAEAQVYKNPDSVIFRIYVVTPIDARRHPR